MFNLPSSHVYLQFCRLDRLTLNARRICRDHYKNAISDGGISNFMQYFHTYNVNEQLLAVTGSYELVTVGLRDTPAQTRRV